MKARVHLTTVASLSVEVEVPDDLDEEAQRGAAIDAAFETAPTQVCAQCSGWGQTWDLELGEFDVEDGADAVWFDDARDPQATS